MPSLKQKCRHPGCNKVVAAKDGYCEEHKKEAHTNKRVRSNRWHVLSRMYRHEHPICIRCGRPSEQVDHIVSLARGGDEFDPDNLAALCKECHALKTLVVDRHATHTFQEFLDLSCSHDS